jgi:hypothetical protein
MAKYFGERSGSFSNNLNRGRPRRIQYLASAHPAQSRSPARRHSGAETRLLLERELAAISARQYDRSAPLPHPQYEARSQGRDISGISGQDREGSDNSR